LALFRGTGRNLKPPIRKADAAPMGMSMLPLGNMQCCSPQCSPWEARLKIVCALLDLSVVQAWGICADFYHVFLGWLSCKHVSVSLTTDSLACSGDGKSVCALSDRGHNV